ncbi:Adenylate cyclase type 3 [Galemys pyrenaicus]|uniref:Adenylate cyclase type 3 n=1 Tax=Galemys pyrenaicus TaxID=202257 RepID=A0A8J6AP08_GALPY|nr:Adenylate cyclase type 3 [Galemys pyrenaicus]
MPRNQGFSDPEYSAEYSAEYSVSLPSDPDRGVGRTHEISVRNSGSCLCLPRFMRLTFVPESLENLYQTYFKRQRHETLLVLVVFAALFDCYVVVMCAVVYSADKLAPLMVAAVGLVLDIILFVLCKKGLLPDRVTRKVVPYLLWLLITAQIFSYLGLNFAGAHAASDTVGWQAFFVFSYFITLPLSLSPIVVISVVSCVVHTLVLGITVAQQQQDVLNGVQLLREIREESLRCQASRPNCPGLFHSRHDEVTDGEEVEGLDHSEGRCHCSCLNPNRPLQLQTCAGTGECGVHTDLTLGVLSAVGICSKTSFTII